MARFNEIQVGRFNRFFQKLMNIKSEGGPAPQLASEIQPVHTLFHGEENRWAEGWDLYGGSLAVGAVAAQNDAYLLRNPPVSNIVAVVTRITMNVAVASTINLRIGPTAADYTTAFNPGRFDARSIRPNSMCRLSGQNNAAPAQQLVWSGDMTTINEFKEILPAGLEIPVLPGDALELETGAVNLGTRFAVFFRERFLEDSERGN